MYGQIALIIACAITGHTHTSITALTALKVWLIIVIVYTADYSANHYRPLQSPLVSLGY